MPRMSLYDPDTIVAIATPPGEGGVGIVRISGSKVWKIADELFQPLDKMPVSERQHGTFAYGRVVEVDGSEIDTGLALVMRAPKSYTKEDVVEINCHGGIVPLRKVLDLTLRHGARLAEPGEFTKRAFINGRIDLTQAEAVLDVIRSKTDGFMKVALGHLEGGLSSKIHNLKEELLDVLSEIEAHIDFSEEDIELASKEDLSKKTRKV